MRNNSLDTQNPLNLLNTIVIRAFLGFCFGLIPLILQPATAESGNKNQSLVEQPQSISTQAQDLGASSLVSPLNLENQKAVPLAQGALDLKQFCQNYPHNSQCSGVTSSEESGEGEQSSEQDPVPTAEDNNSKSRSGWGIVPEISTLGIGGHLVRKISPNLNARVGVNAYGQGIDIKDTEFDYEGDLNLFNVSTLIDVHPFKSSGFRLSAGLVFGNNNIEGTADVSDQVADELGNVEVDGETIDIRSLNIDRLATVDADIDINNVVAPYVGIGGGNAVGESKGLGFWWNLGVVFSGSPTVKVSSNIADNVPEELQAEVKAAADKTLANEEEDLNDELDLLGVYPVLSLGLSYQF